MQSAHSQFADDQIILLLIESSPQCANNLKAHLTHEAPHGYLVYQSLNELSLDYCLSPSSVIIVCSGRSPDASMSLLTSLKDLCPDNPILVTGSYFDSTPEAALINLGATDYLPACAAKSAAAVMKAVRFCSLTHKHQQEVSNLRNSDPLTSANSRCFFYRYATEQLNPASPSSDHFALLSIDLDGFWRFNTRKGHRSGDQVILEFCQRIHSVIGESGTVARLGQDEFAILLKAPCAADATEIAKATASQLMVTMSEAYQYDEARTFLPCSIGIATTPIPGDLDTLLKNAGLARLSAKKTQASSFVLYDQFLRQNDTREYELEPDVANALRGEQFELYLQPQIAISSGKIVGAEALIRWNHPKQGLVMPAEFIELCERNGMIIPIGYWAIHNAGEQLKTIQALGYEDFRISVNLSFRQFQDIQLVKIIKRILLQNGIQSDLLNLELTESALIRDEQHVSHCLKELADLDVTFSLDDFGTGYSSFSLLQKLPINALKIDRSFIRDITTSTSDAEIVRVIINLAKSLEKEVVAEGVETQEQLEFVRSLGCDHVQGYYYSPPVPMSNFLELLKQHNG